MSTEITEEVELLAPWQERAGADMELRTRHEQIAAQLRAAVLQGDELLINGLLSELLRLTGASPGQQLALQLQTLTQLFRMMQSIALTDDLTGLYNRRGFLRLGTRVLEVASRELQPACLVYLDLDNLKHVNDTEGHAAGDLLIRQTADFLRSLFPRAGVHDVLARLGGDEFVGLAVGCQISEAALRAVNSEASLGDASGLPLSVGIVHFDPHHPLGITELLARAEHVMYTEKRERRSTRDLVASRAQ